MTTEVDLGDGLYVGEVGEGGVMQGRGKATWESGDVYEGEWKDDNFHGTGKYTWADGDYYQGGYQQDLKHGRGVLKDPAGYYDGNWANDMRHGSGVQTYQNGDVYDGVWKEDKREGPGKERKVDGTVYEGNWANDMCHGLGVLKTRNGEVYDGEFRQGVPWGKGAYTWSDGLKYIGNFMNGKKHGQGCEHRADGSWLAGNWVMGKHDGNQPVHESNVEAQRQLAAIQETIVKQLSEASLVLPPERLASMAHKTAEATERAEQKSQDTPPLNASASLVASPSVAAVTFTDEDFHDFQIMKMLGKGSFGAVYEAGLKNGRTVCVKVVELGTLEEHKDEMVKLQNEIKVMKRLKHPNIVMYYGSFDADKKLNIFMEYVTGGSLNHYIKRFKTLPLETVRQWVFQVLNGVQYLHSCDVVHRDIKGDNILVSMDGVLKLADFGCSKSIDDVCSKTHGCNTMVGTPYWMAPEIIKADSTGYGTKADIWAVGCTVVEMITGKPPWPEFNSMWAAIYHIANSKGPPTEVPKDLPQQMNSFLDACFERDPKVRPSAAELLQHPWLASLSS